MGILGYPNMDDNNQDGAFGDYSEVYSNFSEEDNSFVSSNTEESVMPDVSGSEAVLSPEQGVNEEDVLLGQKGIRVERSDNGRLSIYLVVLGLLLISAVGMFFYKKHVATKDSLSSSDQTMGDYFYDKTAETVQQESSSQNNTVSNQNMNMATVEVDLSEGGNVVVAQNNDKGAVDADVTKPEKEMTALEKAMAKKKADSQKEKRIGLGNNSVVIPVSSGGRSDPFVPFGQNVVASSAPKFDIVAPPLEIPEADPMVDKIMDFKLSGILFDSVRPSAILNIDGTEQLVHKGDVVMGYRILNITRKTVVVKYGSNTYEVSAGQSIEQGVNINSNSSLSRQFGGAYSSAGSKASIQFND